MRMMRKGPHPFANGVWTCPSGLIFVSETVDDEAPTYPPRGHFVLNPLAPCFRFLSGVEYLLKFPAQRFQFLNLPVFAGYNASVLLDKTEVYLGFPF
jgi:hypothetical protein